MLASVVAWGLTTSAVTHAAGPTVVSTPRVVSSVPAGTVYSSGPRTVSQTPAVAACPKCGRVHGTTTSYPQPVVTPSNSGVPVVSNGQAVTQTSYRVASSSAPAPAGSVSRGGAQNVLSVLNRQRSRQGLSSLRYDPVLQAVAERRVRLMASTGQKSHPPGSFAPGRYEGVGWSSSYSPSGVHACYTSNPNMTAAGAAMAHGRDGVYFAVVYR